MGQVLQEEPKRRGNLDVAEYQTASSLGLGFGILRRSTAYIHVGVLAVTEAEVLQEHYPRVPSPESKINLAKGQEISWRLCVLASWREELLQEEPKQRSNLVSLQPRDCRVA